MRGLIASLLLMLSSPVLAATPADGRLAQVRQLLGLDESLHRQLREQLYSSPDFAAYDEAKRSCISQVVSQNFSDGIDEAFSELLGEDAVVNELLGFSRTDTGSLFFAALREDMQARLLSGGEAGGDADGLLRSLSVEQLAEVGEFSATSAADLLRRLRRADFSQGRSATALDQLQSHCGVAASGT